MSVEHVHRAIAIDNLAISVSVWRYICDECGFRETFHDSPKPSEISEFAPTQRGWLHTYSDGDGCICPGCAGAKSRQMSEKIARPRP